MRTSTSKEASIAGFFQNAPLAAANAVFGIVRATMKERNSSTASPVAPKKRKAVRKPRARKSANPAAEPAPASAPETASAVE
jgi:hypothetical protein